MNGFESTRFGFWDWVFWNHQKDLLLRMNGAKRVQIYKAAVNQDDAILIHTDAQPKSKLPLPVWVLMSHPVKSIAK